MEHMEKLLTTTQRLFDKLCIRDVILQIVDGVLYLEHTGLWAAESEFRSQTISGHIKIEAGYSVGVEIHSPGTWSEPVDCDVCERGNYPSAQQAAKALALLYYENEVNCAMESIGDEDYSAELNKEPYA